MSQDQGSGQGTGRRGRGDRRGIQGRGVRIRQLLTEAEQRMARSNHQAAAANVDEHVAAARLALRAGHLRRAVAEFDRCTGTLTTDRDFMARRGYAVDRLARAGRRTAPPNTPALSREARQAVLRWLLSEEIADAEQAIGDGRLATAVRSLEAAERIDDHCSLVALLHARALFAGVQRAFAHGRTPDLDRAAAYLEQGLTLSRRAAEDSALRDRALVLHAAIGQWLAPLTEQRDRAARVAAYTDALDAWQELVDYYREHPIRNPLDFINYRDRLAHVSGMIARLRREHRPDTAEGRRLAELARELADRQKNLPW